MWNYVCKECGCYLDPGEKCDCVQVAEEKARLLQEHIKEQKDGQLMFVYEVA